MQHTTLRLLACSLLLGGCFKVTVPVRTSAFEGPSSDTLILLLPGFGATDETFDKQGIVQAARDAGLKADMISVNMNYGYYVGEQLIPRLREDILPMTEGYEHVWVLGISMGGLGALITAKEFPDTIDGVILLSSYLGRGKTLDSVMSADRLADWTPPEAPMWDEDLWSWLRALDGQADERPPILLGYGDKDLGPANLAYLAKYLPPERVHVVPGGHTWSTWRTLTDLIVREDLPKFDGFSEP